MPEPRRNPRELGFYFALSQVGLEMVAPMGVGIFLDYYYGWKPWGTIVGFAFGFIGGFVHLLLMVQRHDAASRRGPDDQPREGA